MLERDLEKKMTRSVREAGGLALKWTAPGTSGVPDRIVFLPGGRVVFVELKRPGQTLRPLQVRMHEKLTELGADVRVVDSEADIEDLF